MRTNEMHDIITAYKNLYLKAPSGIREIEEIYLIRKAILRDDKDDIQLDPEKLF